MFFEHEQAEYGAEGISWKTVKFRDNTPCVELLEAPGFFFSLVLLCFLLPCSQALEFCECFAKKVDCLKRVTIVCFKRSWFFVGVFVCSLRVMQMHATHKTNKFYQIPKGGNKDKKSFEVRHFARVVNYEVANFLEKNKDTVVPEVVALVEVAKEELYCIAGLMSIQGIVQSVFARNV